MGAWGAGNFQNDTALDWYEEFRSTGAAAIEDAFLTAETADDLDADEGTIVLAAAEIVAAAFGKPMPDGPADLNDLLSRYQDFITLLPDIRARAIAAVRKVLAPSSELNELWQDAGDIAEEWTGLVNDLVSRLENAD